MKSSLSFIRATITGGIFFLIPIAVVVIVLGKVVGVLRGLFSKIAPFVPEEDAGSLFLLDLVAIGVVILACFLFGLVARSALGKRLRGGLEELLLSVVPGYSIVKGVSESMQRSEEISEGFQAVAVRFDDSIQLAFEIEREPGGQVAVYLPGAPNPWSGSVAYVTGDRVRKLQLTVPQAVRLIQRLGKGSMAYVQRHGRVFESGEPGSGAAEDA